MTATSLKSNIVKVVDDHGTTWYRIKDIGAVIQNTKIHNSVSSLPAQMCCMKPTSTPGGEQSCKYINELGLKYLLFKSRAPKAGELAQELGFTKHEVFFVPKELSFYKILSKVFKHYTLLHQYIVNKYRIDFFVPELNLAIEFDELHHNSHVAKDMERQERIQEQIGCKFVRMKESECIYEFIGSIVNKFIHDGEKAKQGHMQLASLQQEIQILKTENQKLQVENMSLLEKLKGCTCESHSMAQIGGQASSQEPSVIPRRRTVNSDTARIKIQKFDPKTEQCIKVYYSYNDVVQEYQPLTKSKISHAMDKHCLLMNFRWKKVEDGQENEMEVVNLQPTQESSKPRMEPIVQMNQDKSEIIQVFKSMAHCADELKKSTAWVHQTV
ncbi:hypothetical protein BCR44DRAFT_23410 [Catenaria anguillulae PL171]|uniref:Bro-N domain-containing protein n=1 Tax=Catenaria anguillulae PL171 TaxID=765915 RepID=A0A1Y2H7G7_9FUNG|nr:hypothetical protein BCR44DRAFT_23410 [Catenaria anguillulae PL171]